MKRIWAICSFEIKRLLIKPQNYILMFGMPLLFTLIFGGAMGGGSAGKITLAYVDQDHTVLSKSLQHELINNDLFQLKEMSLKTATEKLKDKNLLGMIQISKGFQKKMASSDHPKINFKYTPDFTSHAMVSQVVFNALSKVELQTNASTIWAGYSKKPWGNMYHILDRKSTSTSSSVQKLSVTKNTKTQEMGALSATSAGFSIMFMMIMIMSATGVLLDARKTGVWYRLLSTPTERFEILGGYLLSFFLIGWIQFGLLMFATNLIFGVNWGNLLGIFVLITALLLCVIGLGLFISGFVKTTEQQSALGSIIITATCMLGGVYWPLDIVPSFMQKIAEFIPQTWAMRGFTEIIARGGTIADIITPVGILLAFAAIFLAIGITRVRYE